MFDRANPAACQIEVITSVQRETDGPFLTCCRRLPDEDSLGHAYRNERGGTTTALWEDEFVVAFRTSAGRTWTARSGWVTPPVAC